MKTCRECNELRELAGLEQLSPMEDPHCRDACQLYRQRTENSVPPEGVFAYSIFQRLSSPAVERFALQADVFDALGIKLSSSRTLGLISQLDALMEGVEEAKREIKPPPPAPRRGRR